MKPSKRELDSLRALVDKATPGPWNRATGTVNYRVYGGDGTLVSVSQQVGRTFKNRMEVAEAEGRANAAYIAAAHPAMIAHLLDCETLLRKLVAADRMVIAARAAGTHDGERMDLLHKAYKRTGEAMVAARALTGGE